MNRLRAELALYVMATTLGLDTAIVEKSVASVARKFHASLRHLAVLGFTSSSSILADVRRLVKDAVADAYIEGLAEGGVSVDEMSADDDLVVVELAEEQNGFVTDFVKAIREAKDDRAAQRDILDNRINLWTASIEAAGMRGLASAKANSMGEWRLGDTEAHCESKDGKIGCLQLDGKRHRVKWFVERGYIPRQPGNERITCGGWQCDCGVYAADGTRLL